jgi:hypothetical protein
MVIIQISKTVNDRLRKSYSIIKERSQPTQDIQYNFNDSKSKELSLKILLKIW